MKRRMILWLICSMMMGAPAELLAATKTYGGSGSSRTRSSSSPARSYSAPAPSSAPAKRYGVRPAALGVTVVGATAVGAAAASSASQDSSEKSKSSTPKVVIPKSEQQKPSFDQGAAKARAQENSAKKYEALQAAKQPAAPTATVSAASTPRSYTPSPQMQQTRDDRARNYYKTHKANRFYQEPRTQTIVVYRDPWDSTFLSHASTAWWYHHWDSIDRSRLDERRLRELEREMDYMRAQGIQRNPNYVDQGMDPDLAYRKDVAYQQEPQSAVATPAVYTQPYAPPPPIPEKKSSGLKIFLWSVIILGAVGFAVYWVFFRRTNP